MNSTAIPHWRALLAIIASISAVGLSLGMTIPLVSLNLDQRGVDSSLIGLMAAMPAVGILLFSPLVPGLVNRIGARTALLGAVAVGSASVLTLPLFDHYAIWLLARTVMGAADALLFTVSETWINHVAEERNRGRLVALYITVLSVCFGLGPSVVALAGSQGELPFLLAGTIFCTAIVPLLWADADLTLSTDPPRFGVLGFFRLAPSVSAAVLLFAFLDGSGLSLLPIFGLRHGHSEAVAALMISVMIGGNIVLQYPLGWLADRIDRERLLAACGLGFTTAALLLPLSATNVLLWPVLVLLGISAGGVYTLALIIVGQRFHGIDLVTANAAFGVLWGLGSLLGPLCGGLGMAVFDPDGLPLTWAGLGMVFLILLWRRRGHQGRSGGISSPTSRRTRR